jgi:hypothetical protein
MNFKKTLPHALIFSLVLLSLSGMAEEDASELSLDVPTNSSAALTDVLTSAPPLAPNVQQNTWDRSEDALTTSQSIAIPTEGSEALETVTEEDIPL